MQAHGEHGNTEGTTNGEERLAAAIHAEMVRANELFQQKRYHQARRAAIQLAELDPKAFMPEQIIEACDREIGRRRTFLLGVLAAMAVAAGLLFVAHGLLARVDITPSPAPGVLTLSEAETQEFRLTSALERHLELEYTWTLLDGKGQPVSRQERAALKEDHAEPWACSYCAPHNVASAKPGGAPATRTLIVAGTDAEGQEKVVFQWTLRIADVPRPPSVLSTHPPARLTTLIGPGSPREFRVEALDGDQGPNLTYEWLLDDQPQPQATDPTYAYPTTATPVGDHTLVCRVANRHGEPFVRQVVWRLVVPPREPGTR